jgi:hypothetical protein
MKRLLLVPVVLVTALAGCHTVPVAEPYGYSYPYTYRCDGCSDYGYDDYTAYGSYPVYPAPRYYSQAYVADPWDPFVLVAGVALGYALGDHHHDKYYSYGYARPWYGHRRHR